MDKAKWYQRLANRIAGQQIQKKSNANGNPYSGGGTVPFAFADFLSNRGQGDLRAAECIRLWKECTPFFNSVEMRSAAFASIPPRVYNTLTQEFDDSHPILALLRSPNPITTGNAFLKAFAAFYDICGETFLTVTGDEGSEPLEIYNTKPQSVVIQPSKIFGMLEFAGEYRVEMSGGGSECFYLDEFGVGNSIHYWNKNRDREIKQIRDFNPNYCPQYPRGFARATPLWLQIQQYIETDTNNYSVLRRGGRPSIAWNYKGEGGLTDEQFSRWKEEAKAYEGAINAGRQVLLENMEILNLSANARDMEFSQNRKTVREDIFSTFSIPLSLVSSESMTMDNLKTGSLLLYDNAVLPLADILYDELTRLLMPRYADSENLVLTYDASDIPAIRDRALSQSEREQKLFVLTDNELRSQIGKEPLAGGDVVYKPANFVPSTEVDTYTGDEPTAPTSREPSNKSTRGLFVKEMRMLKDIDGNRVFSDAVITEMADEQGWK